MSAKTLMVNEGLLQEIEKRIGEIRTAGNELVRAMAGTKVVFKDGVSLILTYRDSVEILQEVSQQLFDSLDLCDPEDNELLSRQEEEDEGEDGDEDDEEEDSEEDGEEDYGK